MEVKTFAVEPKRCESGMKPQTETRTENDATGAAAQQPGDGLTAEVFAPLPVSPLERMLWNAEQSSRGMFRVGLVLWLDGCMRLEPLSVALARLQDRHPKLRASIREHEDGTLRYHFDHAPSRIPCQILDFEGANFPWREEMRRLMEVDFPAPGPRMAVTVLRSQASGRSALLLSVHHTVADGQSAIMLAGELMSEYALVETDLEAPRRTNRRPVAAMRAKTPGGWADKLWLWRRFLRIQRSERNLHQTPLPGNSDAQGLSQWSAWSYSSEDTVSLVRRCRTEGASLGGAMIAAVCCALMECLPSEDAVFKFQFPFDLREDLESAAGPVTGLDLGCFASIMNEIYRLEGKPLFWDLARRVASDNQEFAKRGGPAAYFNSTKMVASRWFSSLVAPRVLRQRGSPVTLLATHYGMADIREAYGSLRPRECVITFKTAAVGASLVMEGMVMNRRLNLGLVGDSLNPDFWERLQASVREHLDSAAGIITTRMSAE